ncbi:uncharacterized protein [Clytia hemisphaerica]|uniref:Thioredoxin n=1 Tax=Clytia hemisphaerica TaxID=252671 RepID=A0A7M5WYY7_9CNID|eukprot:TCONS_00014631-protein
MKEIGDLKELNQFIGSSSKVVVEFHAEWCGPCRRITPQFKQISEGHPNISFALIDMDGQDEICDKYKIDVFPTFIFYHNSKQFAKVFGANEHKLRENIEKLSEAV